MPAPPPRFHSRIRVNVSELSYSPFSRVAELSDFSCGVGDLDDFIHTGEVQEYAASGYGQTTLVWRDKQVVAYYTVGLGELSAEKLKVGIKTFHTKRFFIEENVPTVKLRALAVDRRVQGKGIGRILVAKIAHDATENPQTPPIMVTRATPQSIDFYRKCGFVPVSERPKKVASGSLTLFFRLDVLGTPDIRVDVPV